MIGRNHPVREAFSGCSTGNANGRYYDSKDSAFSAFNAVLLHYGYCLDRMNQSDGNGSATVAIWKRMAGVVGYVYFTWYRMDSSKWEVIGYIT